MLRVLLFILAVLVAVLAFLLDRSWLYVGASIPLLGALGLLGWQLWSSSRRQKRSPSLHRPTDDSLEDLGIMEVRPQAEESPAQAAQGSPGDGVAASPPKAASSKEDGPSPLTQSSPESSSSSAGTAARSLSKAEPVMDQDENESEPSEEPVVTGDAPVLGPFLQSLRAALDAHTAGLLVQEEVVLTYRIEALASVHSDVQRSGHFDAQVPLLSASMSRRSVTVRMLEGDELSIDDLGYYERPPDIDHVAVAPVPRPESSSTTFLIVDAPADVDLGSSRSSALLERYAKTVALVLDGDHSEATDEDHVTSEGPLEEAGSTPSSETADEEGSSKSKPRPRREIIAEEMEAAEAASEDLALVLAHLNRAESIARRGPEAVDSAERLLRARLEQMAPNQRVERFGELTYGIFFRGDDDEVEPWAVHLQETMAQETGELEGGTSIGVAVWRDRHNGPEALRSDATEALWEAYETGTCTIVE